MSFKREDLWLDDVVDYADRAIEFLGDLTIDQLSADLKTLAAVERCLQCITEAALRIGEERMGEIAPFVSLSELRGLGNRLRHSYDSIDPGVIHGTVKNDIPALRDAAARALED